jgi:serine/threonine protein kinase
VDVWALGCLCYLLSTLSPPFKGQNLIQLGHDIVRRNPKPLREDLYSVEWRCLISDLLTKRAADRPTIFQVESRMNDRGGIKGGLGEENIYTIVERPRQD